MKLNHNYKTIQKILSIIKRDGLFFSIERKFLNKIKNRILKKYYRNMTGVIHIGANTGQERDTYNQNSLNVIWIEPIPYIFEELKSNISNYPKQKAYNYLITDIDNNEYELKIANNNGESSSILDLGQHLSIYPEVYYTNIIRLKSITLDSFIMNENINLSQYNTLVLDTQGSEMLILNGSKDLLNNITYVVTEAADFEAYLGCCKLDEITNYLSNFSLKLILKIKFAHRKNIGNYFNVVYKKI